MKTKFLSFVLLPILLVCSCNEKPSATKKEMEGINFSDVSLTYDGLGHTINASNYPVDSNVTYTNAGPHINVGTYRIDVNITHPDYKDYSSYAILSINKATMNNVVFENSSIKYDGNYHTITATNYPINSEVTYQNAGPYKEVGTYSIGVIITNSNYVAYTKTVTLTITSDEPIKEGIGGIEDYDDSNWKDGSLALLDCGSYQMPLPKNYKNPFVLKTTLSADASSWSNNNVTDLSNLKSNNFRYVYKNSCDDGPSNHKSAGDFYSSNDGGGIKLTTAGEGFQSSMFTHEGAKLEIRFTVSTVKNASGTLGDDVDMARLYLFNKYGELLSIQSFNRSTVNATTTNFKLYYNEANCKDVAYFEFRMISKPYKGSQFYNFGISEVNFKSWERA